MSKHVDLLALRERLGWSQMMMAQELGVDRSTVSRIETGKQRARGALALLMSRLDEQLKNQSAPAASSPAGAAPSGVASTDGTAAGAGDIAPAATLSPDHEVAP